MRALPVNLQNGWVSTIIIAVSVSAAPAIATAGVPDDIAIYRVATEGRIELSLSDAALDLGWSLMPDQQSETDSITLQVVHGYLEVSEYADGIAKLSAGELIVRSPSALLSDENGDTLAIGDTTLSSLGGGWTLDTDPPGAGAILAVVPGTLQLQEVAYDEIVFGADVARASTPAEAIGQLTAVLSVDMMSTRSPRDTQPNDVAASGGEPEGGIGPDVTASRVGLVGGGSMDDFHYYGSANGIRAFSIASTSCNIGDQPAQWQSGSAGNHPVIGQNMYRLLNGRFEQLGQSWLKHSFCALSETTCGPCQATGCSSLGINCADTYWSTLNDGQSGGPKSLINPQGQGPGGTHNNHNWAPPTGPGAIRGRLQIKEADISAGGRNFAEIQYVTHDEALERRHNNASWREVNLSMTNISGVALGQSSVHFQEPGIMAWAEIDPNVTIVAADVPGEGRFNLGYNVTDNGDGTWHYEYALHNMNSDRSAQSFSVPVTESTTVTNVGFHDVDYHSGEPYDGTNWTANVTAGTIIWKTQTYTENINANALRWGTLYNFRFDADAPPKTVDVTIGLFKPGTPANIAVPAEGPVDACPAPAFASGAAGVSFDDRAFDGYIDPRAESTDGANLDLGIDTLTIVFNTPLTNIDGTTLNANAFTISDTAGTAPAISAISTEDSRVVTLTLSHHIALQQWTTIAVQGRAQCNADAVINDAINIGFLPADVDQNEQVNPFDLLIFRQLVNETTTPDIGVTGDYTDINRDESVTPFDLLAFRQLINGTPPATRTWSGQSLPQQP